MTCDGPLDWINTEDTNAKMRAQGWEVIDVQNGSYDVHAIVAALTLAKAHTGKPVFVNIRTVIGIDTAVAGTYKAHHGTVDDESARASKIKAGLDPSSTHTVPPDALKFLRECRDIGISVQRQWEELVAEYTKVHPEAAASFQARFKGNVGAGVEFLNRLDTAQFAGNATRETNGVILEQLWKSVPSLFGGGADLVNSNKISYSTDDVFLPQTGYKGRYLRNGIREHAMASVANGLAAYNPGTFLPVTATFLMFFLYVSSMRHKAPIST